jgi:hypothetical protein
MVVEIITGLDQTPIRLDATQVVVRLENGAPLMLAAYMGPDGVVGAAIAGDVVKAENFRKMLRYCGIKQESPEVTELDFTKLR